MQLSLKNFQQYRNTIFVAIGLLLTCFLLYILWLTNKPVEYPTLSPNSAVKYKNPVNNQIDWQIAKVGLSRDDAIKNFGEPSEKTNRDDIEILIYLDNPTITTRTHEFWIEDNQIVKIIRTIDSSIEDIYPDYYQRNFGEPEVLREYVRPGDFRWLSYKVNEESYIILEYDPQVNKIYQIINTNKKYYELSRKDLEEHSNEIHFGIGEEE